jgi:threonine dehydratase
MAALGMTPDIVVAPASGGGLIAAKDMVWKRV